MRILFTATLNSSLAARWISQLSGTGWDIHVFGTQSQVHPLFRNVTVHQPPRYVNGLLNAYRYWPSSKGSHFVREHWTTLAERIVPDPAKQVAKLIEELQPDCIHSLKMKKDAYYVLDAKEKYLGGKLPAPWIYSAWGSDIYLYRHFADHVPRIRAVLSNCDYFAADNPRDIDLAVEYGFTGEVLGVFPTGGGYDIAKMQAMTSGQPTSKRDVITVKGYQSEHGGKALTALEALRRCGSALSQYKIVIHSAIGTYASGQYPKVKAKAEEVSKECDVAVEFLPLSPPEEIWKLFGRSRVAIAISDTDGTPNAMLEAMIMGAYPIQSDTGGLEGWITSGVNGALVRYDDPDQIAAAILKALNDDSLVDSARSINQEGTKNLDGSVIRPKVVDIYKRIVATDHNP